uniref:Uncharacterized protein n=1 Tax=Megaselia scalaris TaxID=36166 RepID=T1GU99_MEGSC
MVVEEPPAEDPTEEELEQTTLDDEVNISKSEHAYMKGISVDTALHKVVKVAEMKYHNSLRSCGDKGFSPPSEAKYMGVVLDPKLN